MLIVSLVHVHDGQYSIQERIVLIIVLVFSYSSGEKYDTRTINLDTSFSFGFVSSTWFATLVIGANSGWNVINRINTNIHSYLH